MSIGDEVPVQGFQHFRPDQHYYTSQQPQARFFPAGAPLTNSSEIVARNHKQHYHVTSSSNQPLPARYHQPVLPAYSNGNAASTIWTAPHTATTFQALPPPNLPYRQPTFFPGPVLPCPVNTSNLYHAVPQNTFAHHGMAEPVYRAYNQLSQSSNFVHRSEFHKNGHRKRLSSSNSSMRSCSTQSDEPKSIAEQIMAADGSDKWMRNVALIPASASNIAPHPAVEDSGVPYAVFAADLVWELCDLAQQAAAQATPPKDSYNVSTFGAIGSERNHHHANKSTDSISSIISGFTDLSTDAETPSDKGQQSAPLTPPSSAQSLNCPIPEHWQSDGKFTGEKHKGTSPWTDDYWEASMSSNSTTRERSSSRAAVLQMTALASFRRFTDALLSVTLVTPQTLLLALLYVDRVLKSHSHTIQQTFSARSVPYKIFVGALVLANKVLDDNSYTSLTWSKVSAIKLKEISQTEAFMFSALNYDLDIKSSDWLDFIHNMIDRRARSISFASLKDPLLSRLVDLELPFTSF